jgi:trk system potassium uptake protein TrkH
MRLKVAFYFYIYKEYFTLGVIVMNIRFMRKINFTPVRILSIGFALVIFTGAVLLTLPIAATNGKSTPFVDCIFTSTSAVCVTGLVTVDTGTHWTYFGKTVIISLIQIGGLGFMSFATLIALLLGKKITLRERLVMQEAMNAFDLQGLVKMAKYILIFTFSVEFIGALFLATQFIPEYGIGKGLYYSIFHSISAFCNAGFDLIGDFRSLTPYYDNTIIIVTIGSLIAVGGLGFAVWTEIYNNRGIKRLSLHSKVAITMTLGLIIIGTILMFLFEYNNPGTMKNMDLKGKLLSSWFAAVTPRTAGYNSISTSDMTMAGRFLTVILMFIGGSPGSTAGGVKTTTIGIVLFSIICIIKGKDDTEMFKKRLPKDLVQRALVVSMLGFGLVILVTMILSITEVGASFEYLLYEATSAFATVGLTLGLTTKLSLIGKLVLAFTMYLGRVGTLTVVLSLTKNKKANLIRYPEDKILVG